jgi:hypothetical protein
VILTLVGQIAVRFIDLSEGYVPLPGIAVTWVPTLWVRWDSYYYLNIAQSGYAGQPDIYGFFPLFPALIALSSRVTGLHPAASGLLIAQLSYLGAILGLYKLARLIRDDHAYAMRCVLSLILFPTSLFYLAVYAESLYLALAIFGAYLSLAQPPRYIHSGLVIGLACVARPVGWLLDQILAVEYLVRRRFSLSSLLAIGVGLFLSGLGVIAFVYYLYTITGTFLAIPQSQAQWQRAWQFPWITYGKSLWIAVTGNRVPGDWFLYAINWVDLLFTTLALALAALALWWSYRGRFRWSLSLYLVGSLVFMLSSQGPTFNGSGLDVIPLWGMCRWVGALFPLYLVMGQLFENRIAGRVAALVSAGTLIIFTAWWISGRWVG